MPATLEQIAQAQTNFLSGLDTNINTALTALNTLANREYSYTHEALVTEDLEKDYQSIITETPSLADVSAVGMLAVLKNGDTVTAQSNRLFINGEEVVNPNGYTFSGANSQDGIEIVKIWWFENGQNILTLQESLSYPPVILVYKIKLNSQQLPSLSAEYTSAQTVIVCGDYTVTGTNVRNLYFKENTRSNNLKGVYYWCSQQEIYSGKALFKDTFPSIIDFPNLKKLSYSGTGATEPVFFGVLNAQINLPKLEEVRGGTNSVYNVFYGGNSTYVLPESLDILGNYTFRGNPRAIVLNCKNASTIENSWCVDAPTGFDMCSDWGASINIATAATNWTLQQFTEFLNNGLRDMTLTEETRTLTIPSAKLTALQADTDGVAAIAAANEKGWTIGGA